MAESGAREPGIREISFPEELSEELGVEAGRPARVLPAGPHSLVLAERAAGEARSGDSTPVLVAQVRAFSLADVLGWVHEGRKSGLLHFREGRHDKRVYLHLGEVIFASSNQRVDRLGECLVRAGVISLEQLREAERRFTPPQRFGKTLVERGFLTPRELWNGVKYQVEEIVRSLFSYTHGWVTFWEGEVQPDNVVRLSLPTRRLVQEGIQRREALQRFLALLEDPRVRIEPIPERQASLEGAERELFDALDSEASFSGLRKALDQDALSVARMIQLLRLAGAVRIRRTRGEKCIYLGEDDLRAHDEEAIRECVVDHLKLVDELTAPLIHADGVDAVRERVSQVLSELAARFPELLGGLAPNREAALDPEELAARALHTPARREAQVREALGELITYLEFEIKNNPRVPDADAKLEALRPQRARLHLA